MRVSQILITDETRDLPLFLKQAVGTIKEHYPYDYFFYDKETLRQFIKDNFNTETLWAYDKLRPYAYKSGLGRFCLLLKYGGWYFDIAVRANQSYEIDASVETFAFRDIQRYSCTSWSCNDAVIYSKPDNKIIQTAIELIIRNCKENYYGITPLCVTGPSLWGEALAVNRGGKKIMYGELRPISGFDSSYGFFLEDDLLFLSKPCEGGHLSELGVVGGNNYNDFWNTRKVYVE